MTQICLCLIFFIALFNTKDKANAGTIRDISFFFSSDKGIVTELRLSAMDALDLVKESYAANFDRIYYSRDSDEQTYTAGDEAVYYYKLPVAEYYLVYEGYGETEQEYLIHLYEFVVDEPEGGIGHTVTYGWYKVDSKTGVINEYKP